MVEARDASVMANALVFSPTVTDLAPRPGRSRQICTETAAGPRGGLPARHAGKGAAPNNVLEVRLESRATEERKALRVRRLGVPPRLNVLSGDTLATRERDDAADAAE